MLISGILRYPNYYTNTAHHDQNLRIKNHLPEKTVSISQIASCENERFFKLITLLSHSQVTLRYPDISTVGILQVTVFVVYVNLWTILYNGLHSQPSED